MKKSCISLVASLVALMAAGLVSDSFATDIGTAEQFASALAADPDGEYTLTADIDLSGAGYTTIAEFSGTLDGAGHTISGLGSTTLFTTFSGAMSNLTVDGGGSTYKVPKSTSWAPICITAKGADFTDVTVKGYTISWAENYVTASSFFAAQVTTTAEKGTTYTRCQTDVSCVHTPGNNCCGGGLAGKVSRDAAFYGTVLSMVCCTNNATIDNPGSNNSSQGIGGLVGILSVSVEAQNGVMPRVIFDRCVNNGTLTSTGSNDSMGGLIGQVFGGNAKSSTKGTDLVILGCENYGCVSCTSTGTSNIGYFGGLIGQISSYGSASITGCVNHADISAVAITTGYNGGGLIGKLSTSLVPTKIVSCANYGEINAGTAGGIVGFVDSNGGWNCGKCSWENCANYGAVRSPYDDSLTHDEHHAGQMVGSIGSGTGKDCVFGIRNCWGLNGQFYGMVSKALDPADCFYSTAEGYSNAAAVSALNVIAGQEGFVTWVQGRYYPELAPFASSPTAGKVDVIFRNWDGYVVGTDAVDSGSAATAPVDPTRRGHVFSGWNVPFDAVTGLTLVTAVYDVGNYTYDFDTRGGSTVASITADFGVALELPADPVRAGYVFKGWSLDKATVIAIETPMPAENRTYYAIWYPENGQSAITGTMNFLGWNVICKSPIPTELVSGLHSVLQTNNIDLVTFDNFKSSTYVGSLAIEGYQFAAIDSGGSSDGNARVFGWKTSRFVLLCGPKKSSPTTNCTTAYAVFEDLETGNQYLVVNGFYGSANKTVTDYKKALNSHVSSLKTPYPAATVIWYGEYSQITKNRNSDYSNNYGSSYENVLNAFLGEMEGFSAIRAGDDFQWTLADIVPTAVAVSSVVDTDVSTSYTGYISSFTLGAPSAPKGLMLLFR